MFERFRLRIPWQSVTYLAVILVGVASFGFRFWMQSRYAAPSSADFGLYLSQAQVLLGHDVEGFGPTKPPVFFLGLLAVMRFTDPVFAARLLSTLVAAVVPVFFFFIVSRYAATGWALAATILFAFAEGFSEMTGWGGGPDFLAISFMLASTFFVLRYLDDRRRKDLLLAGIFASLVVGTHHLSAFVLIVGTGAWALLEVLRTRSVVVLRPFGHVAGLSGLLSLPYLPSYLSLWPQLAPQLTPFWPDAFDGLARSIAFIVRDSTVLWIVISGLSVVGGVVVLRDRREGTLFAGFALTNVLLALTVVRDNPTRPMYYLYFPLLGSFPAFLGWAVKNIRRDLSRSNAQIVQVLLVVFVVSTSVTMVRQSLGRMSDAVDWYHPIDAEELEALYWLRDNTPRDSVVATAGIPFFDLPEGTRYAWWIQGLADRKAFYGGSEVFAVVAQERLMVQDANRYFAGNYVLTTDTIRVAENHPGTKGNPEVSIYNGRAFVPVAYLDDGVIEVRMDTGVSTETTVLSPALNGTASVVSVPSPSLESVRSLGNLSVRRSESVVGSEVIVSFELTSTNSILEVILPAWIGPGFLFVSSQAGGSLVNADLTDNHDTQVHIVFEATSNVSATIVSNATNGDARFGVPQASFRIAPAVPSRSLALELRIRFPDIRSSGDDPTTFDASAIARSRGLTHVFQSKRLLFMYLRFLEDEAHFELLFENVAIGIFRFK